MSSSHLGGRAIDRYNPIITAFRRRTIPTLTPTPTPSRLASPDVCHLSRQNGLQKGKDMVLFDDERAAFTPDSPDRTDMKLSNEDHDLKLAGSNQRLHKESAKHLSKMEGVTSFNIDFAAKKITVIGDLTPLNVLGSISTVKNAQFWPFPSSLPF